MSCRKVIASGFIAVWMVFLFFFSVPIREDVSRLAHHFIDSSAELPLLTRNFSMRILGAGDSFSSSGDSLFYFFWGVLWVVPLGVLFFVWRIKSPLKLMEFLFYSWMSYLLICILLFSLVLYGLFLPFLYG